jgi:hypothetical protein
MGKQEEAIGTILADVASKCRARGLHVVHKPREIHVRLRAGSQRGLIVRADELAVRVMTVVRGQLGHQTMVGLDPPRIMDSMHCKALCRGWPSTVADIDEEWRNLAYAFSSGWTHPDEVRHAWTQTFRLEPDKIERGHGHRGAVSLRVAKGSARVTVHVPPFAPVRATAARPTEAAQQVEKELEARCDAYTAALQAFREVRRG